MPDTTPSSQPHPPPTSRRREVARNIFLAAASTLFFFLCVETVLRVAELAPTETLAYPDEAVWERFPGPYAPGQDFVDRFRPRLPHHIRINALGFRGPEFRPEKPAGGYRVLCLGDSYTFGDYVNDEDTFPVSLEKVLRRSNPGRTIEVINAGVNGYTITDEAALADEKGLALGPDAVIVVFVLNDLADLTRKISSRENQRIEARRMSTSALTPLRRALRRTATYNFLFVLKAMVMARAGADPTIQEVPIKHLLSPPYDERTEVLFARYREELVRLKALCDAKGVKLWLMIFPFYEQVVEAAPADAQARLTRIAVEAGVPSVDLLPAFRRAGARASRLFLMPLDHHPSASGYHLAAREMARAMEDDVRSAAAAAH